MSAQKWRTRTDPRAYELLSELTLTMEEMCVLAQATPFSACDLYSKSGMDGCLKNDTVSAVY